MSQRKIGTSYEQVARRYLENAGLRFYAANVIVRGGELDLIMQDDDTWVFVEVRYRRYATFGTAAASITRHKQRHLLHAAAIWLATRHASFDTVSCRFDVIAITGNEVEWITNAFTAE